MSDKLVKWLNHTNISRWDHPVFLLSKRYQEHILSCNNAYWMPLSSSMHVPKLKHFRSSTLFSRMFPGANSLFDLHLVLRVTERHRAVVRVDTHPTRTGWRGHRRRATVVRNPCFTSTTTNKTCNQIQLGFRWKWNVKRVVNNGHWL